ncbi:MAG: diguanylate cyclase [Tumebacillaceae bacterium]
MDHVKERSERSQRLLKRGRELYVHELIKHIGTLERLMTEIGTQFDLDKSQQIYRIAHQMKGSGPIFGFDRVGKAAEELEELWEWAMESGEPQSLPGVLRSSQTPVLELKMEYEIGIKELQFDEQELQEVLTPPKVHDRVLLIDDDELLRSLLVAQFELSNYKVDEVGDVDGAKKLLREHAYDVILLDLMMYPKSGYELFDFLKEDPTLKWIPLVVLSGRNDVEDKVRCLRLGADDYVTKPFQYEELEARVYSLLKRSKQFEQMAFRDALTGVFNRRYFDHHLQMVLQWNQRDQKEMSLVFIDIDEFKHVNDTYGHHVGDLVLQGLGHMLQRNLRTTDLLARYGGEELVILLADTDMEQAVFVMERILSRVRKQPMARYEGQEIYITFSAGIAPWTDGITAHQWTMLADSAMYRAKQSGRDRVLAAKPSELDGLSVKQSQPARRKRVLIIDDDEMIRSMVRGHLLELPIDIEEAADGEEGFQKMKLHPPDLCLLDGILPRVDGLDVLGKIRHDPQLKRVKVLMVSSRRREEDVVAGLQHGADDYVVKPFSLLELELRVRKLLDLE